MGDGLGGQSLAKSFLDRLDAVEDGGETVENVPIVGRSGMETKDFPREGSGILTEGLNSYRTNKRSGHAIFDDSDLARGNLLSHHRRMGGDHSVSAELVKNPANAGHKGREQRRVKMG
ncbi:hypothetical protein [Brevundimonas diminuta]|uniref:hypothetical protein n=1 Tax=Brevundimonas diminuta TaxID=293 RepID=UPI003D9A670C